MGRFATDFALPTEHVTVLREPGRRAILLLRWGVLGSLLGLSLSSRRHLPDPPMVALGLAILLVTGLVASLLPQLSRRIPPLELPLLLLDTAVVSYVTFQIDVTGYLCLFFFILLISTATTGQAGQILLRSLVLASVYLVVWGIRGGWADLLSADQLLVIPFFCSAGPYYGFQALADGERRLKGERADRGRQRPNQEGTPHRSPDGRGQAASADQLRDLFDNSPDLILYVNPDGGIRDANHAAEILSGRTRPEILSGDLASLVRGLPPVAVLRERVRGSGAPLVHSGLIQVPGKSNVELRVTIGRSADPEGGLVLVGRDVTDQNLATATLRHRETLSTLGEIVATVAHELNNPLSGVRGFAQLVSQKDTEGKFKRDIDRIIDCSDRCQKIVQNLLSFARPTTPNKKPVGLNGILEKTLDLLQPSLREDNVEVLAELAPDLPSVYADFHQVQQVLTNLITNAQHAMSADKKRGQLKLRTYAENGQVVLEVGDDGPGITAEVLPRIFDPFFSTKKEGRGTGLGLSVSYGIVRDHGGELRVETRVGQGTTFFVTLPTLRATSPESPTEKPAAKARASGKGILVVDDEGTITDLFLTLLEALGHGVDTAANGLEALQRIKSRDYDLIISDIKMPKMSGIELYEKVISANPQMRRRFIFITGDMSVLTSRQFLTIADSLCLIKPLSIDEIESTIHEVLAEPILDRVGDVRSEGPRKSP